METERQNKAVISESSSATSKNFMEEQTTTKTNDEERLNPKTSSEINNLEDNLELVTLCHELDEYQKAFGESCINVQRNFSQSLMTRDILLERLFQKAWLTFTDLGDAAYDDSLSLQPKFLDPLDLSGYLSPKLSSNVRERGVVHLQDTHDYYEADLWMWNMTLSGLSDIFLHEVVRKVILLKTSHCSASFQVKIVRDEELEVMIIMVETRLSEAMISGHYNMTGWLGWPDTTFGDGDTRPMSANVTEVRMEVSLVLDTELDTCLGTLEDVDLLSSQLSFDAVTFSLDQELQMSGMVDTALQVTTYKYQG